MDKNKELNFSKRQITLEEKIAESANSSIEDVTNVMVKELILENK